MQIQQEFSRALDALIEQVKGDRSIVAAILCGSLSHDTVWAKSDIDLVLVTVDDKKLGPSDMALYADGVNVHTFLMPRTEFRKTVESSIHNSVMHSFLAKGRLLYSHDPTIVDLCAVSRRSATAPRTFSSSTRQYMFCRRCIKLGSGS